MQKVRSLVLVVSVPILSLAPCAASAAEGLFGRLFESDEPEVSQSIWREDDAGEQLHLQTSLRCPDSIGSFERIAVSAYDGFGFDVACKYDDNDRGRITLYLTLIEGVSIEDYFEQSVSSAESVTQGELRLGGGNAETFSDDPEWLIALYDVPNERRTGVWVKNLSGWALKYRATYEDAHQEATFDAMSELSDLAHLSACALTERPIRQGSQIEDTDILLALALLAGAQMLNTEGADAEFAAPYDGESPPVSSVEDTLAIDGKGFLLWRNIASDGKNGPSDRVTATSLNESPALEVIVDPGVTAFHHAQEGASLDSTVFTLAIRSGNVFEAYGFFVDRPDWATLGAFADSVFSGRRAPIASVDTGSNQINLNVQDLNIQDE